MLRICSYHVQGLRVPGGVVILSLYFSVVVLLWALLTAWVNEAIASINAM